MGMAQVVEMVGRADFGVDGDRSPPPAPTELILNTVALSLISPRRAGGDAEALAMPSDRMDSCLRRNDGRLGMAQVVEMVGRADFGVDGDRSPPPAPTELILNTVALSLISPRKAGGDAEACPCAGRGQRGAAANISVRTHICEYGAGPPPSFLRRQESMRPPNTPRLGALDVPPMYRTRALGDQSPSDDRSPCDALRSHGFLPAQE